MEAAAWYWGQIREAAWKLAMLVFRWSSSLGVSVWHMAFKMAVRAGHSGILAVLLVCFGKIKQEYKSFVSSFVFN